jgi:hypothetical protein
VCEDHGRAGLSGRDPVEHGAVVRPKPHRSRACERDPAAGGDTRGQRPVNLRGTVGAAPEEREGERYQDEGETTRQNRLLGCLGDEANAA